VVIVEHRGARWMLGVSAGGISTIAHWPPGASATPAPLDGSADAGRS
jgi:flagellar protein FliO/FliZ